MNDEVIAYRDKLIAQAKDKAIWEKKCLTIEEAAAYSGIGIKRIRSLIKMKQCPFALSVGTQMFIVREKFDEYISKQREI